MSLSASDILNQLQGSSITNGWDVINALDAQKINSLLQQQFVKKSYQQQNLPPINDTTATGPGSMFGTPMVQFVNVTLGTPLVSFSPTLLPQQANLQIPFVSGIVNSIEAFGTTQLVMSSQVVLPGSRFSLQGIVPLSSIEGEVNNGHDVVIDIVNGTAFVANLGMPAGAETYLGTYFLSYLATNAGNFSYALGTVIYDDNGTQLVPVKFDFATQTDATDPNDTGRLLLFIATEYNPNGGSQTSLSLSNIVPTGSSMALLLSSQVLFAKILQPSLQSQLADQQATLVASQANAGASYLLTVTAGSVNAGKSIYPDGQHDYYSPDLNSVGPCYEQGDVMVPLSGLTISPANNGILIKNDLNWTQKWIYASITGKTGAVCDPKDLAMTAAVDTQNGVYVNSVQNTVSFQGSADIPVTYPEETPWQTFWDCGASDAIASQIQTAAQTALNALFNFNLPEINLFAVTNLLFPNQHLVSFKSGNVPGDLLVFGDLQTPSIILSPADVMLTAKQSQSFTATRNGQSLTDLTWTITPTGVGTIDNGLYTAPNTVPQTTQVVIAAINPDDSTDYATALVTLVPKGVLITPYIILMSAGQTPQPFFAVVDGSNSQDVVWSISPSVGTISADGVYTPPTTVSTTQAVTITAKSQSNNTISGTATVVLVAGSPLGLVVSPNFVSLSAGEQAGFSVAGGAAVNWSLYPRVGVIQANGNYTAPNNISDVQGVVVMATSQTNAATLGTAVIALMPALS